MNPEILKTIFSGAIAVSSTLLTIGISWLRDRGANQQRAKLLEEVTKSIAFWELWLKAQQLARTTDELAEVRQTAQRELDYASQQIVGLRVQGFQAESTDIFRLPSSRLRRLLLLYRPRGGVGWVPRILFYSFVIYFWAFVIAMDVRVGVPFTASEVAILLILFVGISAVFRSLTVWLDRAPTKP
jgi:hypothetical protein